MIDRSHIDELNEETWALRSRDPHQCLRTGAEVLVISERQGYLRGKAEALRNMAFARLELNNFREAFSKSIIALDLFTELNDDLNAGRILNNMGICHFRLGDHEHALGYFMKSLEKRKASGDRSGEFSTLTNIGLVYQDLKQNVKALDYFHRGLEINKELNETLAEAKALNNIGGTYTQQGDWKKALEYFLRSLWLKKAAGDRMGSSGTLINIAECYQESGDTENALKYFYEGAALGAETNNKLSEGAAYLGLGGLLKKQGRPDEALDLTHKAMNIFVSLGTRSYLSQVYRLLSDLYRQKEETGRALEYFTKHHETEKEIYSIETSRRMQNIQLQHELESARKEAEIERLRNTELKAAYQKIEEKNKQITDSINYAKRIQHAILPGTAHVEKLLPEHFILFRPKDIVSGDFYFVEPIGTNAGEKWLGVAAADCTGHGVPGAFMSMLGTNGLRQSLTERSVNTAGQALDYLSRYINAALRQDEQLQAVRDGMDIGFAVIDPVRLKLYYAGANNPAYVISEGLLTELKGDTQPVGYFENQRPFSTKSYELKKGDCIYLFTDGYADQFGGPKEKKFKYSQFKELLTKISIEPMARQKELLESSFEAWKGEQEQVDDILVIGIKV